MGILNVTPDSFSDGGQYLEAQAAVSRGEVLVAEGADIVDIGGLSTRFAPVYGPVAEVDEAEEIRRIAPVVEGLAQRVRVPLSIDTYRAAVARVALGCGASIVNDVWGLTHDADMAHVVAAHGATVVLMHNQASVVYDEPVQASVVRVWESAIGVARRAGIPDQHIWLDPGFGFGKTTAQNWELFEQLGQLKAHFKDFPLLVGVSRKAMLGQVLDAPVHERLWGTVAATALAAAAGADIVRVHDVRPNVHAARIADAAHKGRTATPSPCPAAAV